MADGYPANAVSLRSVADGNFVVIDVTGGKKEIIAEVDYSAAALTLYEGAIYMIQARPWQVEKLDWPGRKAFVTATRADYYTDAIDYTKLKILERFETAPDIACLCAHGEVHLVRRVAGYKKIRYYTHENIGWGNIALPDHEMHTSAIWWTLAAETLATRFASRWEAIDGLLGAAWALHHAAALLSLSERRDLGRAVGDGGATWSATVERDGRGSLREAGGEPIDPQTLGQEFQPTVFLYDNYPGGIGLAAQLFDLRAAIVEHARTMIGRCECSHGCPACVGPILATDATRGSPKRAALAILDLFGAPVQAGPA
jgi:DEAD/DEAH box helicase domain-containing protein